jgi:hypothetical protein
MSEQSSSRTAEIQSTKGFHAVRVRHVWSEEQRFSRLKMLRFHLVSRKCGDGKYQPIDGLGIQRLKLFKLLVHKANGVCLVQDDLLG